MTFFAEELKKIADRCDFINDPKFAGRVCMFRVSDSITGRMEFATQGIADKYSALKISLFNRTEGMIDSLKISIVDMLGMKPLGKDRNTPLRSQTQPHIWIYGKEEWYGFTPNSEDYELMAQETDNYISIFAEPAESEEIGMGM